MWRGRSIGWTLALALLAACDRLGGEGGARAATPASGQETSSASRSSADDGSDGAKLYRQACIMCHGEGGRGTQLGPSLADAEWRRAQGGAPDQIAAVVRGGVPDPGEFPVPMPARGDGTFDNEEVAAVSSYVQSLSR
ncbi:MAG TPA: cytochrome c [Longimicrobium sp.]|jgi:mono/diheme cytochrome c family protein